MADSQRKTANLAQWEKGGINISTGADETYRTKEQGGTCEQLRTQYISCIGNVDYVLSTNKSPVQTFISFYDENKNYLMRTAGASQGDTRTFKTNINAKYMRAQMARVTEEQVYPASEENAQFAITLGSTVLPYEPYWSHSLKKYDGTTWQDASAKEYVSDATIADWEKMSIAQMENYTIQELQGGNWV